MHMMQFGTKFSLVGTMPRTPLITYFSKVLEAGGVINMSNHLSRTDGFLSPLPHDAPLAESQKLVMRMIRKPLCLYNAVNEINVYEIKTHFYCEL